MGPKLIALSATILLCLLQGGPAAADEAVTCVSVEVGASHTPPVCIPTP